MIYAGLKTYREEEFVGYILMYWVNCYTPRLETSCRPKCSECSKNKNNLKIVIEESNSKVYKSLVFEF